MIFDQHEHEGKRDKIRVQREGLRGGRGACRGQDRRITNGTKVERGNTKNIEPPHLGFQIMRSPQGSRRWQHHARCAWSREARRGQKNVKSPPRTVTSCHVGLACDSPPVRQKEWKKYRLRAGTCWNKDVNKKQMSAMKNNSNMRTYR